MVTTMQKGTRKQTIRSDRQEAAPNRFGVWAFLLIALLAGQSAFAAGTYGAPTPRDYEMAEPAPLSQSATEAANKSSGCNSCHTATDHASMHANPAVVLGCTDCHGGNAAIYKPEGSERPELAYSKAEDLAHVLPLWPASWKTAANPPHTYTLLNRESPEFIRFVNPSDYRVADYACGACHQPIIEASRRSLMSTGAMLWGGAAYNNGILPFKRYVTGEFYAPADAKPAFADRPAIAPIGPLKPEFLEQLDDFTGGPSPAKHQTFLAAAVKNPVPVTPEMERRGVVPVLYPLPTFETMPPADIFRVFERGGRNIISAFAETGLPNSTGLLQRLEEPGRPDLKASNRGPATGARIAVPVLNLHKTRLNDPYLWFLGTNEQPGDYRSSGCAACHVVYANDREPRHSGPYAKFGHGGTSQSKDPTISKTAQGHPLKHEFTRAIPTAQCMVCHMHQPNIFLNSMLGYTMWDYESNAPFMWPEQEKKPSHSEIFEINKRNPEEAAIRGKWGDLDFLKKVWEHNDEQKDTTFADYHGHGWNFRAIYKRDKKGNLLDAKGGMVDDKDPHKFNKAQQLYSIHVEKGMHCTDCHFSQDMHGNGHLQGEVAQAIEIECQDCHGTVDKLPTLRTSGPAAPPASCPSGSRPEPGNGVTADVCRYANGQTGPMLSGTDLSQTRVQDGRLRFEWVKQPCSASTARKGSERSAKQGRAGEDAAMDGCTDGFSTKLFQRSSVTPGLEWEVHTVKDSVTPGHKFYNAKAARAKLMTKDTETQKWGGNVAAEARAHKDDEILCVTCHSSWTTSCFGCHLPIQANWKTERQHFEGGETRNYATYNPQVARDDFYMLGKHGEVKGNRIAPVRSSSALILSSTNSNREQIYVQQAPVSAGGYSSQAFAPHYPHTERTTETKTCSDCHLSKANDNNAWMASLLGLGTNFVNFVGYHAYVGSEQGVAAVRVTEWDEPQAVIGSYLHRYAYPERYARFEQRKRQLPDGFPNRIGEAVRCVALRGEYLYAAQGPDGMQAFDAASVGNKGFSQKLITAPFLANAPRIKSKNATCVALPTNQPINPAKNADAGMRAINQEQLMHPLYSYALVSDAEEGLILVNVNTLADGDPRNNGFQRALTWMGDAQQPQLLKGARYLTIAGTYVYVLADAGLVTLNLNEPLKPQVESVLPLPAATSIAVQFRYAFATTPRGLEVLDLTQMGAPKPVALLPMSDARRVYVARTYAYVAAGKSGLQIVDVQNPTKPFVYQSFNPDNRLQGANDVVVGSTNASLFAYVADDSGLHVVQLTDPDTQPKFYGFSPDPKPVWIAHWPSKTPLLALSKGLDRDRAVDETGHQIAVFGRIGSRPFSRSEMERLFMDKGGKPWFVED